MKKLIKVTLALASLAGCYNGSDNATSRPEKSRADTLYSSRTNQETTNGVYYHKEESHKEERVPGLPWLCGAKISYSTTHEKEEILSYRGKLFIVTSYEVELDSLGGSVTAPGKYIIVPGNVLQQTRNEHGKLVSDVTPIRYEERGEIEKIVKANGFEGKIRFWN